MEVTACIACRFAPEIRFHPLEDSFLVDPADWFADAVISAPEPLLQAATVKECSGGSCVTAATSWPQLQDRPEWCVPALPCVLILSVCPAVVSLVRMGWFGSSWRVQQRHYHC